MKSNCKLVFLGADTNLCSHRNKKKCLLTAFCLRMIAPFHTDEYVGGFVSFHSSQASVLHPDIVIFYIVLSQMASFI